MAVIGCVLPDVRDGLKPVHRRAPDTMYDGGYRPERSFNKCARVSSATRWARPPARRLATDDARRD
ncbi:hypothetical protein QJS66_14425 [Kocuria rhizophila]|nr:hypothetical protein QJS66_14425 [Kocuria rhizophila]